MRRFIAFAAVLLFAQSSQAVTLYTKLVDLTGGTVPGVHSVGIYIMTDPNSSADDSGFSGAQFDVIAQDTNSNYTGTFSLTGSQVLNFGYSRINPSKVDATSGPGGNEQVSAMMPQPVTGLNNGNLDAVGFSIYNIPGTVDPTAGALGQTGGFEFVGKEAWSTTNSFDVIGGLRLYLTGAQYFADDFGNTFKSYDAVVYVPEPSSVVLAMLGGMGLATLKLRRQIAKRFSRSSAVRGLIAFAAVLLFAQSSQAVTLYTKLQDLTGGTAPGVHSVGIYIMTDPNSTADDFGFAGAQFDVIAQDTNSNYTGNISLTGSQVLALGYSRINPSRVDATTSNELVSAMMPQPVTGLNNGNLDAVGFSIYGIPGTVDPSLGALGQTGGFEFVGKEAWNTTDFSFSGVLKLYLTGAQYFADEQGQTFKSYDAVVFVPEPASIVLMGLSGSAAICFACRKKVC